jgi:hypothetical protein
MTEAPSKLRKEQSKSKILLRLMLNKIQKIATMVH